MEDWPLRWRSTHAGAHLQLSEPGSQISGHACHFCPFWGTLLTCRQHGSKEDGSLELWVCKQASLSQRLAEGEARCLLRLMGLLLLSYATRWWIKLLRSIFQQRFLPFLVYFVIQETGEIRGTEVNGTVIVYCFKWSVHLMKLKCYALDLNLHYTGC